MALRAFRSNPSIGGFGCESLAPPPPSSSSSSSSSSSNAGGGAGRRRIEYDDNDDDDDPDDNDDGREGGSNCDAFAQIVKELVDNAVDACGVYVNDDDNLDDAKGGYGGTTTTTTTTTATTTTRTRRRVRVTITPVMATSSSSCESKAGGGKGVEGDDYDRRCRRRRCRRRDLLRVEVSDNGCGMSDIDYCVSAFGSSKNDGRKDGDDDNNTTTTRRRTRTRTRTKSGVVKGKGGGTTAISTAPDGDVDTAMEATSTSPTTDASDGKKDHRTSSGIDEGCTSGRYGVGLTLCLLHAQRLVPGTGACVTSASSNDGHWVRATYEPDADGDVIICRRRENFAKARGESGTTISLMVPGGNDAVRAWPRLAEYFSRFHLVANLPCSLEVKAPTLQSMPLYIRPPGETEEQRRRIHRTTSGDDDASNDGGGRHWDGGDGCDEGVCLDRDEDTVRRVAPEVSKAAHQRAEAEVRRKEKISMMCQAAAAYKRRPDLKVENVAHTVQPIRRDYNGIRKPIPSPNGPVLEMSLIVLGPNLCDADNHDDGGEGCNSPRRCNEDYPIDKKTYSELQIVRIVNGIPMLDSSEALACGVINKVSSNSHTWNSFGLNVTRKNGDDQGPMLSNELNIPTFVVNDSAQVAPFLKDTTHSLFRDQRVDWDQSSSDDDEFDSKSRKGKRKKMRQMQSLLPAALRLGEILMVVQIRAKPSALPLPTLSKGRLPLNDKGISDAIENGIAECLQSLQRSSPGLLLTAQQLKGVERDVKYVPAATCAITSILCRSTRGTVYDNAMNIMSSWDDQVKRMGVEYGIELGAGSRTIQSHGRDENARFDALHSILERRLRFIVSDEFKYAKKANEKEQQKRDREGSTAFKKRTKKNIAHESDGMKSDCFDSDDCDHSTLAESTEDGRQRHSSRDYCRSSTTSFQHGRHRQNIESSVSGISLSRTSSVTGEGGLQQSTYAKSRHGQRSSSRIDSTRKGEDSTYPSCQSFNEDVCSEFRLTELPVNSFNDGYESSPKSARASSQENNSTTQRSSRYACDELPVDGFQSEERRQISHCQSEAQEHDDAMSSDSDWSSEYGEVVAGHIIR